MEIVDANVILRYLLKDHKSHFIKSKEIIDHREIYIPMEVLAEVVYVLEKVYDIPSGRICFALTELLAYQNISTVDKAVSYESLNIYKTENIDFVDALLVSYHRVNHHRIHSFDKKVNKLCRSVQ
ncbi:PIN domain-containing protein [Rhodohalobacter halophilus]|uniref:PIN domain-containing protein n=1 Tax=Rhodohalobacter halophilus TaxID=1812810 RepID=UPI00083F8468|nr:PIN domain-containing protein [Rhodohalobacter halophilus]